MQSQYQLLLEDKTNTFVNAVLGTCNINKRIDDLYKASILFKNIIGNKPLEDLIF